jgi:thioredoxin reductase (NADPH)
MANPILLAVDDEHEVLRAIERDLRRQYGEDYRVLRAESGASALEALRELKLRNEAVALLLVDQRMPNMTGVELIEGAMELFPDARRVLLTAYADTDAAIRAINSARIDYYLLKPWDPPEERLYPVLTDLLEDWRAHYRPPFEGVRILGHRWSPVAHELRSFLARNQVPYQWLDVEADPEARLLFEQAGGDAGQLPLVLLPDGARLAAPAIRDLAEQVGLRTRAELPFYDLVIVGAGPAGLAAGVYGASEGLRTIMVESMAPGGQAGTSSRIENYLGFPSGLSGADLARRAVAQARRFGVEILTPQEVSRVRINGPYRIVTLSDGSELSCHALLITTGVSYRRLDVAGIDDLVGLGVYYGGTMTEARSHHNEHVYVVGGANSAGQAAIAIAKLAHTVTLVVRGASLAASMSRYLIDQIEATPNIVVALQASVTAVSGTSKLEAITIANTATGVEETQPAGGLFIYIGAEPRTDWLDKIVARDAYGFVLTGPDVQSDGRPPCVWPLERAPMLLETSVPGIFAAGDVRHGATRRVASGVGEGAIAVQLIQRYLSNV